MTRTRAEMSVPQTRPSVVVNSGNLSRVVDSHDSLQRVGIGRQEEGSERMLRYFSERQDHLAQSEQKFRDMEQAALSIPVAPLGTSYLCFRLDGIKVSKRFLKGSLSNEPFYEALRLSIQGVYQLLRRSTGEEYGEHEPGNFFLCAFCISDEVSFILNNRRNHLENRVFKTGTTLAGTLSGALSLNYQSESKKHAKPSANGHRFPMVMAFDARPLILNVHDEVEEYILHRWLLAGRNTMSKVLRLAGVLSGEDVYRLARQNDLPPLCELIERNGLVEQYHSAMRPFTLFLPSSLTHDAKFEQFHPRDGTSGISLLTERVRRLREQDSMRAPT